VLQHVSLEVKEEDVRACVGFWERLGFSEITPPPTLRRFTWVERGGTHIHLIPTEQPAIPQSGHAAVVVEDFDAAVAALEEGGFSPEPTEQAWGVPRAFVIDPAGHRVELMASPPTA
jgi:catechol 2,3-dioxygenase-like lactoylglutathione lyase family enzyme